MAGYMYLGNKKVCPAIVVKSGYNMKNAYFTENVFTNVDSNGKLTSSETTQGDLVFTGFKDVGDNVLGSKFRGDSSITNGVIFNDLEKISGRKACNSMFHNCPIKSVSFKKLKEISGQEACYIMFWGCQQLSSVSFPELATISGGLACEGMFMYCTIKSVSFQKLSTISGYWALSDMFSGCSYMEELYFPALTTSSFGDINDQFDYLFDGDTAEISGNVTVHFPSNLQSTIAGLEGYPTFGGTSGRIVLAFDLPATS